MSKKLRVGIIGVGTIGAVHADAYRQTGQADIVALCDINEERLNQQGERLGIAERYLDHREMLRAADIEAVDVCVPNYVHRECAAVLERLFGLA